MEAERKAKVVRDTKETSIVAELNIDGTGVFDISTGIGFFDHMLAGFAKHGFFDLSLKAKGDLNVDSHHTVEDVGIVIGQAIREALGNKAGITRYGFFLLPMDETLVECAIDLYNQMICWYEDFVKTENGKECIAEFNKILPDYAWMSDVVVRQIKRCTIHQIISGSVAIQ